MFEYGLKFRGVFEVHLAQFGGHFPEIPYARKIILGQIDSRDILRDIYFQKKTEHIEKKL